MSDLSLPAGAICPRHPGVSAVAVCSRCGTFVCVDDLAIISTKQFCLDCAKRSDGDYLEAFRLQYWGKRDTWAWLFGIGGLVSLIYAGVFLYAAVVTQTNERNVMLALAGVSVLSTANGICFWLGLKFARIGTLVTLGLTTVPLALQTSVPVAAASMAFPFIITLAVIFNTRTMLFFKVPVSRAALQRAWDLYRNNVMARTALTLGVGGVLFGGVFAPFAIICGIIGLRRVNPTSHPPIGKKGHAIAGLVLGVLGTLMWGGIYAIAAFG